MLDSVQTPLLPSAAQMNFAKTLAQKTGAVLPWEVTTDRQKMSAWITERTQAVKRFGEVERAPSSKQVAFAEQIARRKRRSVPQECFRSAGLMSRWITTNK